MPVQYVDIVPFLTDYFKRQFGVQTSFFNAKTRFSCIKIGFRKILILLLSMPNMIAQRQITTRERLCTAPTNPTGRLHQPRQIAPHRPSTEQPPQPVVNGPPTA